jgi:hypothetical protein
MDERMACLLLAAGRVIMMIHDKGRAQVVE